LNGRYQVPARLHGPLGLKYHPPEKTNTISLFWKISSYLITCVTEIRGRLEARVLLLKKMVKDVAGLKPTL